MSEKDGMRAFLTETSAGSPTQAVTKSGPEHPKGFSAKGPAL